MGANLMRICFDIDNTLTVWNSDRDYENFKANDNMVELVNKLYDEGHEITLFTSRGMSSVGADKTEELIRPSLERNLHKLGFKYHHLILNKPYYDIIVDDKSLRPDEFMRLDSIEDFRPYVPDALLTHKHSVPISLVKKLENNIINTLGCILLFEEKLSIQINPVDYVIVLLLIEEVFGVKLNEEDFNYSSVTIAEILQTINA
ncbi:phosphoheptose isomerase [Pseudomonas phage PspYZU05]|uniref:Uncharacterized protein n=1 Tax=Pseudomonas phage PspYZU05 TaxID=1983556 RepID=A0A2U7N518_9CAUD|nr:phosphoheptose isomerase [Pseudomonas phage PspYZU05]ASD52026.1 hypothetical protein PspYZU05_74 [Pseudomonas phage PspYZU05]